MSREDPQMKIRLPADLKDQIEAAAKVAGRSMNAEITTRLEQSFGARQWVQEIGLTEKLEEAVRESGRTMEGEIYARLLASLNNLDEVAILKRHLDAQVDENRRLRMELAELRSDKVCPADTIYLLLDASGYPISWDEIGALWKATASETNIRVANLDVVVITPDMESNSRRTQEAAELARRLKEVGRSTVIPKYIPGYDPVRQALEQAATEEKPKTKRAKRS